MGLKDSLKSNVKRLDPRKIMGSFTKLRVKFSGLPRKKKITYVVIAVIILLLIGVRVNGAMSKAAAQKAAEMNRQTYTPVEALTVKKQTISSSVILTGKVQGDKEAPVMVKTPGKVAEIQAKVGDVVKKDQVLFSLDKTDAMITFSLQSAQFQMAQGAYETSMRKYENDKKALERTRELYKIGAVSKVELDQAEFLASDSQRQSIEGQFAQARAAYESASKTLADMDVKSPIDGVLTALDVSIGAMVSNTASVAKVVDMEKVFVTVSVSEKEINNIQRGQEVLVEVPSASTKVKGKIEDLSLAADNRGKYNLKTYIDNKEVSIKPGMFANVTLNTATKENVLVVPTDAVVFHKGRNVVYLVGENGAVEKEVKTGLENGMETEVISGLQEGDVVITKGQNFLSDGSQIKVVTKDGQSQEAQNK
ncbi:MAG: efflux RND transporter periplasmic adaptor subunit [Peptococcaceae bacterium]|nr:efflux RND transporter periplasmic adaptor subunit [Peptococcaceae bacterium]